MTFRIAHISDLHLLDLSSVRVRQFLNKRVAGGLNLLLRRAHAHRLEVVNQALKRIEQEDVDHVVVTGDLTNLSLHTEFELANRVLEQIGGNDRVSVVPGNHDNYTHRAHREGRFEAHLGAYLTSDLQELSGDGPYPFVKLFDSVAIIGLSSAIATPLLYATGYVGRRQIIGLYEALRHPRVQARFKIVLVHHPIVRNWHRPTELIRRLVNARSVLRATLKGRADLVLSGHNHQPNFTTVVNPFDGGVLSLCEAGSASLAPTGGRRHPGSFNIYEIDGEGLRVAKAFKYQYSDTNDGGRFTPWKTLNP